MNVARTCLVLVIFLSQFTRGATLGAQAVPSPPPKLNSQFVGHWVGTLEYRDFGNNQQVLLPTWLTLVPGADGNTVNESYIYDDGPTKIVRESSMLTLDAVANKATVTSDRDKSSDNYDVVGFPEFIKLGRGILVLTGTGHENDKVVDVRITLTLRRNLYSYRKETKLSGEEFKFRDAYTFTSRRPASLVVFDGAIFHQMLFASSPSPSFPFSSRAAAHPGARGC